MYSDNARAMANEMITEWIRHIVRKHGVMIK